MTILIASTLQGDIKYTYKDKHGKSYTQPDWIKKVYLEEVQFPAEPLHTPRVLFEFVNVDEIMPSPRVYYYFFVIKEAIFGKYMVKRALDNEKKYKKRIKLMSADRFDSMDDDKPEKLTPANNFFNITQDEYLFFLKYFNIYKKEAIVALAEGGAIGGHLYIKANERFLIRMICLLKKQHNNLDSHNDVEDLIFGGEIAQLGSPPKPHESADFKRRYFNGMQLLSDAMESCQETNAVLAKIKLRKNLWRRIIFKSSAEAQEEMQVFPSAEDAMTKQEVKTDDEDDFELL